MTSDTQLFYAARAAIYLYYDFKVPSNAMLLRLQIHLLFASK